MTEIRCPHCGGVAAHLLYEEPTSFALPQGSPNEAALDRLVTEYPWRSAYRTRILNAFVILKIKTFRDLCRVEGTWEISRLGNIGQKTINEINRVLATLGMRVGMFPPREAA
jgi:hypothetical protein